MSVLTLLSSTRYEIKWEALISVRIWQFSSFVKIKVKSLLLQFKNEAITATVLKMRHFSWIFLITPSLSTHSTFRNGDQTYGQSLRGFIRVFFPTWQISAGRRLHSVFITLPKGYFQCDCLCSFRHRLFNVLDTRGLGGGTNTNATTETIHLEFRRCIMWNIRCFVK